MSETEFLNIRKDGRAGRITLTRPQALNALSQSMCAEIAATIDAWATDETVEIVILDASGERAFCAGGDLKERNGIIAMQIERLASNTLWSHSDNISRIWASIRTIMQRASNLATR